MEKQIYRKHDKRPPMARIVALATAMIMAFALFWTPQQANAQNTTAIMGAINTYASNNPGCTFNAWHVSGNLAQVDGSFNEMLNQLTFEYGGGHQVDWKADIIGTSSSGILIEGKEQTPAPANKFTLYSTIIGFGGASSDFLKIGPSITYASGGLIIALNPDCFTDENLIITSTDHIISDNGGGSNDVKWHRNGSLNGIYDYTAAKFYKIDGIKFKLRPGLDFAVREQGAALPILEGGTINTTYTGLEYPTALETSPATVAIPLVGGYEIYYKQGGVLFGNADGTGPVDAGNYEIWIHFDAGNNFIAGDFHYGTLSIAKAKLTKDDFELDAFGKFVNYDYNCEGQGINPDEIECIPFPTFDMTQVDLYYVGSPSGDIQHPDKPSDIGAYNIRLVFAGDDNFEDFDVVVQGGYGFDRWFNINQRTLTLADFRITDLEGYKNFNFQCGTPQGIEIGDITCAFDCFPTDMAGKAELQYEEYAVTGDDNVDYDALGFPTAPSGTYISKPENVGFYRIVIVVNGDATTNFAAVTIETNWTYKIMKSLPGEIDFTFDFVAGVSPIYDCAGKEIDIAENCTGMGVVEYSFWKQGEESPFVYLQSDNTTWPVEAGEYYIYINVDDSGSNYLETSLTPIGSFEIEKADLIPVADQSADGNLFWDALTYPTNFPFDCDYHGYDIDINVVIPPLVLADFPCFTDLPEGSELRYLGIPAWDPSLVDGDDVKYDGTTTDQPSEAGCYEVFLYIPGDDNFNDATIIVNRFAIMPVTITDADVLMPTAGDVAEFVFDCTPQGIDVDDLSIDGFDCIDLTQSTVEFTYDGLTEAGDAYNDTVKPTEAGTYSVIEVTLTDPAFGTLTFNPTDWDFVILKADLIPVVSPDPGVIFAQSEPGNEFWDAFVRNNFTYNCDPLGQGYELSDVVIPTTLPFTCFTALPAGSELLYSGIPAWDPIYVDGDPLMVQLTDKPKDVGCYKVELFIPGDDNFNDATILIDQFFIKAAELDGSEIKLIDGTETDFAFVCGGTGFGFDVTDLEYTGDLTCINLEDPDTTVEFEYAGTLLIDGSDFGPGSDLPTEPGSYTVSVTIDNPNYGATIADLITFEIGKGELDNADFDLDDPLTTADFDCDAHGLTIIPINSCLEDILEDLEIETRYYKYDADEGDFETIPSTTVPSDAGLYKVTLFVPESDFYNEKEIDNGWTVEISRADISGDLELVFDGEVREFDYDCGEGLGFDATNLIYVGGITASCVDFIVDDATVVYEYTGTEETVFGPTTDQPTLPGDYYISKITIESKNYFAELNIVDPAGWDFVINKITPDDPDQYFYDGEFVLPASFPYTGTDYGTYFSDITDFDTEYCNLNLNTAGLQLFVWDEAISDWKEASAAVNAGKYKVALVIPESDLYNAVSAAGEFIFNVGKIDPTPEDFFVDDEEIVINQSTAYYVLWNGEEQCLPIKLVEGIEGMGDFDVVYFNNTTNEWVDGCPTDIGWYHVYVRVEEGENYNATYDPEEGEWFVWIGDMYITGGVTIDCGLIAYDKIIENTFTHVYDGNAYYINQPVFTGSASDYTGIIRVYYGKSTDLPVDAGTYVVRAVWSADAKYAKGSCVLGKIVITKAVITLTADNVYMKPGATPTLTWTASGLIGGELDNASFRVLPTLEVEGDFNANMAGVYDISFANTPKLKHNLAKNYELELVGGKLTITGDIIPSLANLHVAIPLDDYVNHVTGVTVRAATTTVGLGKITIYYNNSTVAPTGAGVYIVTVDIAKGDNYGAVTGLYVGRYTIFPNQAAIMSFKFVLPEDLIYNGLQQGEVKVTTELEGIEQIMVKYNGSTTIPRDAGNYVVTISTNSTNYVPLTDVEIGSFSIAKKMVDVIAVDQEISVGAALPSSLSVKYEGFVTNRDDEVTTLAIRPEARLNVGNTDVEGVYVIDFAKEAKLNDIRGLNYELNHINGSLVVKTITGLDVIGKSAIFGVKGGVKLLNTNGIVDIYSIDGRLISSTILTGDETVIPVSKGVVLVKNGDNVVKVAVQ